MAAAIEVLPPERAYPLWAPSYGTENGVTLADRVAVERLSPPRFERLLDAGCGTGRRMPGVGFAAGADLVLEMLLAGARPRRLANGDLRALPYRSGSFDLVWCRLALGHVAELAAAYRELARVCRATVVTTDIHPALVAAGFSRDFRAPSGERYAVVHHLYDSAAHRDAARDAGLWLEATADVAVGPDLRPAFEEAGKLDDYEAQLGLPVVSGFRFRKGPGEAPKGLPRRVRSRA